MKTKIINNKGLTIIELIISVALISVVMLFMYKLLADVSFERDNDFFASLNQAQRIEIIDTIEKALMNNAKTYTSGTTQRSFQGTYSSTLSISSTKKTLTFVSNGVTSKWNVNGNASLGDITCSEVSSSDYKLVECKIPVYTSNTSNKKNNNNTIDDIAFSFITTK